VNQLCSPTRTSLISSRYAYNLGLAGGVITNGHPVALRLNESSVGEHFKALGHRTHAFGKWDCGYHTKMHTPTFRGFDTFVGYYNADEDYNTHSCGGCGCPGGGLDLHDDHDGNLKLLEDRTTYSTVLYTAAIIAEIEKAPTCPGTGVAGSAPFFLYAAYQAVHGPLEAPQKYIDECVREGVIDESGGGDRLTFCGMVKALDEGVGNITAKLAACGLDGNTVIGLTADNGGQNKVGGNNWPLRGNKVRLSLSLSLCVSVSICVFVSLTQTLTHSHTYSHRSHAGHVVPGRRPWHWVPMGKDADRPGSPLHNTHA
jgi:arylsulfatase B